MGSPPREQGRSDDETRHDVTITEGFYLGATEVTNAQFRRFRSGHRSGTHVGHDLDGDAQPAVMVSFDDARSFCEWLASIEGTPGVYRLPTEAEWERACGAGSTTAWPWGDAPAGARAHANGSDPLTRAAFRLEGGVFPEDDGHRVAAPFGTYRPNAYGLFDMIGNVWEWCADRYGPYPRGPASDPTGPATGSERVLRGGSWLNEPAHCRSAHREWQEPLYRSPSIGFRVVAARAPPRPPR